MKTEMIKIDRDDMDLREMKRAGEILKKGGLVAFPTETVYGLGGDATSPPFFRISPARFISLRSMSSLSIFIISVFNISHLASFLSKYPFPV